MKPWTARRKARFEDSVSKNPYFFFAPFSGILVSEAGIILPRELYANRSAAEPDKGVLPADVLLSFYGCAKSGGGGGALDCPAGHERIPDNWYRRSSLAPFTFAGFMAEVADLISQYLQAGSIGGNTGTVNSFAGVDLGGLTGGVFHAADLTDPDKLGCFLYQVTRVVAPSILKGLLTSTTAALGLLDRYLLGLFAGLECPQLNAIDQSLFDKFPGAKPF